MKKLFLIFVIFLTAACAANQTVKVALSPAGTPVSNPTLSPEVDSFLDTALAPYGQSVVTNGTATPIPATQTPAVATATPDSIAGVPTLEPGTCPTAPFFVRVRPFPKDSNAWLIYIPDYPKPPATPYGYPATLFLQRILNATAWTHDTEYINLSDGWLAAMSTLNGSEWKYLQSGPDGTFFNDGTKLGVDTFPGNVLLVTNSLYRKGECWDEISTAKYKINNYDTLAGLDATQLGNQVNMHFDLWPQIFSNGVEWIPLIYQNDSAQSDANDVRSDGFKGGLWLEDFYLEPFPGLPVKVTTTTNLNIRASCDFTSSIVDVALTGTPITITAYQPVQTRTFAQATDGVSGKSGCATLYYAPVGYTTTWKMDSMPVPPQ
jgi:hypothetical protein